MLITDIIITEMIMIEDHIIITEIDIMILKDVVAVVVMMIVVAIYVHFIVVIHVVNALEEICVLVSRS